MKLLTIITEALLEKTLVTDFDRLGAHGYTITEARGKGNKGTRSAGWETNANIRIEIVCDSSTCQKIVAHLQKKYYDDYAMILFTHDVDVLRPEKF
jgi:nitrogen regulatory protein PII